MVAMAEVEQQQGEAEPQPQSANAADEAAPATIRYLDPAQLQWGGAAAAGEEACGTIPGAGGTYGRRAGAAHSDGGVLVIAEKPSVAKAIAMALSKGRLRTTTNTDGCAPANKLHYFHQFFTPAKQMLPIVATSVCGHLFSLDFHESANRGVGAADPGALYTARTEKVLDESTARNRLPEHLRAVAAGCQYLYLWLDCDREGENICFEVVSVLRSAGQFLEDGQIFRSHFSALTPVALHAAWRSPRRPDAAEAMSVDARQELDLKIGCSFTRHLTRQLVEGAKVMFGDTKISVISFGPCQTPTLAFTTNRHDEIEKFVPRAFWGVALTASAGSSAPVSWVWSKPQARTFKRAEAVAALAACQSAFTSGQGQGKGKRRHRGDALVHNVRSRERRLPPPTGLDTVQMLRACSAAMGMSPHTAMVVAERLYTSGLISYPRTESSRYPPSFDVETLLRDHASHEIWGASARLVLSAATKTGQAPLRPPLSGIDRGDHPPITPMRACRRGDVRGGASDWRLYEFVARHFIASMMPPLRYSEHVCSLRVGGDHQFTYTWHSILDRGWADVMPWRLDDLHLNLDGAIDAKAGDRAIISSCQLTEGMTEPPPYLKECELQRIP